LAGVRLLLINSGALLINVGGSSLESGESTCVFLFLFVYILLYISVTSLLLSEHGDAVGRGIPTPRPCCKGFVSEHGCDDSTGIIQSADSALLCQLVAGNEHGMNPFSRVAYALRYVVVLYFLCLWITFEATASYADPSSFGLGDCYVRI
jgi:hypothetical protein